MACFNYILLFKYNYTIGGIINLSSLTSNKFRQIKYNGLFTISTHCMFTVVYDKLSYFCRVS